MINFEEGASGRDANLQYVDDDLAALVESTDFGLPSIPTVETLSPGTEVVNVKVNWKQSKKDLEDELKKTAELKKEKKKEEPKE